MHILKSAYRINKEYHKVGKSYLTNGHYQEIRKANIDEMSKSPTRTELINYLLSLIAGPTHYLEIGVRNPEDNFSHIRATHKYGVDPGIEFEPNQVEFKMTSDSFFEQLATSNLLSADLRFDVIFIDGLHLAEQVDRDIANALNFVNDTGFVVLHDCNPISEWHARERYTYYDTPAGTAWNGTTWKAFLKWRCNPNVYSCCVDSDWGIGLISKTQPIGKATDLVNPFFEFTRFDMHRKEYLNLIDFESLKISLQRE